MRLTMTHVRWAAIIAGWGLLAFAAMRAADQLIGHTSPFTPGIVSAIFSAGWIFLCWRYGPRGPVDPRRQRIWLLSGIAAGAALAVVGLIAASILATRPAPSASCPALTCINSEAAPGFALN
jgi:hypothetical protein